MAKLYQEGLGETEFARNHLYYSLFIAVAHCLSPVRGMEDVPGVDLSDPRNVERARNGLDRVGEMFTTLDIGDLGAPERQFMQDTRRATTDEVVRVRRTTFLLGLMS